MLQDKLICHHKSKYDKEIGCKENQTITNLKNQK